MCEMHVKWIEGKIPQYTLCLQGIFLNMPYPSFEVLVYFIKIELLSYNFVVPCQFQTR